MQSFLLKLRFVTLTTCCVLLFACAKPETAVSPDHPRSNLGKDETVVMLPTNAYYDADQKRWHAQIHGWVFEPERDSVWRNNLVKSFAFVVGVQDQERELFAERMRMFLVDNKPDRHMILKLNGQIYRAPATGDNGHFEFDVALPDNANQCSSWLNASVVTAHGDERQFRSEIQCNENTGVSVISDIDDTIKDSHVLDKKELMKNTFVREFRDIPGMAALYQHFARKGYQFHYVSSSPWQLFPALDVFLQKRGFPKGSMHLKLVRFKDSSFMNLFATPEEGKIPTITALFDRNPQRQFILVGDSGEKDPDIYKTIFKKYPHRVRKILIHDVARKPDQLRQLFADLPADKWAIFNTPDELGTSIATRHEH